MTLDSGSREKSLLLNVSGHLDGKGFGGRMVTCICMVESLCCSPETITTMVIGYNPIQNKKFFKKSLRLKPCENVSIHCQPFM